MERKYRAKIAPSGIVFVIITLVLGVGAANTANNLLYLMTSLMLSLIILSGLSSFANFLFLKVSVTPPEEVFAGIPAPFGLSVEKGLGHSFFLRCETPYGDIRLPLIRGRSMASMWLRFDQRGLHSLPVLRLKSGFPLGFFWRTLNYHLGLDVLVYPRPLPCLFPALAGETLRRLEGPAFSGELGDEIKELRAYREGDPLRWIDWKATARKGEMVSRDFFYVEGDTLMIDLARKQGDWERTLSEACYLVIQAEKRGLSVALNLPGKKWGPGRGEGHKHSLLEALARA